MENNDHSQQNVEDLRLSLFWITELYRSPGKGYHCKLGNTRIYILFTHQQFYLCIFCDASMCFTSFIQWIIVYNCIYDELWFSFQYFHFDIFTKIIGKASNAVTNDECFM